jgi:hypothetical protein
MTHHPDYGHPVRTVRIPDHLWHPAKAKASRDGSSISAVTRDLLEHYLDRGTDMRVTPDTLNSRVDFDCVFRVHLDGTLTPEPAVWAPEISLPVDAEGYLLPDADAEAHRQAQADGWTLMTGYSGQDRYSGPLMHSSEYLGGGMARDVLETPGLYVLIAVECDQVDDCDDCAETGNCVDHSREPAGWAVAYRHDEETHNPECVRCDHDCPWSPNRVPQPLGAPFCSVCDDHSEAAHDDRTEETTA